MKLSSIKKFIFLLTILIVVLVAIQNKFFTYFSNKNNRFSATTKTIEKAFEGLIDVHVEEGSFQQVIAGAHHDLYSLPQEVRRTHVAIGGGITSAGIKGIKRKNFTKKLSFFVDLLPSFCRTASQHFNYNFYLAYDAKDLIFNQQTLLLTFKEMFILQSQKGDCLRFNLSLHLVICPHNKKPAWAQNDAMMEAYLDGNEYFYRINDDSKIITANWTEAFVDRLSKFSPANVGVVGPNHKGGNLGILTYDFVHRSHVDIFGFYYPRIFTDWYADEWITKVYKPDHMEKIHSIKLAHTQSLGRRYDVDYSLFIHIRSQVPIDKVTLQRYKGSFGDVLRCLV